MLLLIYFIKNLKIKLKKNYLKKKKKNLNNYIV